MDLTQSLLYRRRQMMAAVGASGGGLPYDAEIEYLETDGGCYIDTGIVSSIPVSVQLKMLAVTASLFHIVIGYRIGSVNIKNLCPVFISSTKLVGLVFDETWSSGGKDISTAMSNSIPFKVHARLKNKEQKSSVKLDTESSWTTKTWTNNVAIQDGGNMYLFANNNNGTANYKLFNGDRIYYCKIYSDYEYSNLVRDFIPVRKNGIGYMYDKVSGQLFGNAGSGSFTLGPDKT